METTPKPELKAGTYWDDVIGRYVEPTDPDWDARKFASLVGDSASGVYWEVPES